MMQTKNDTMSTRLQTEGINLALLVGTEIIVYSSQFPGRALSAKVVSAQPGRISVESGEFSNLFRNMVNQQKVVLQFINKGQHLSAKAELRKNLGGSSTFVLEEYVTPLARRRFERLPLKKPVNIAPYPMTSYDIKKLASLKWIATESIDLSSGGMLVTMPGLVEKGVHLLIAVEWNEPLLPSMVLGKICYCHRMDGGLFNAGVEFVVEEESRKLFSAKRRNSLPQSVFEYTNNRRNKLNRKQKLTMNENRIRIR